MKFIPQYEPKVSNEYATDVFDQISSGWIGTAKKTEEFEGKISEITGAEYVVSTTSGTTALMLALCSMDLPAGSTILFPNYTFIAGANAARFLGFKIKLIDVKEDTLCMDPSKAEEGIDRNVSAIMFVNHNAYIGNDVLKIRSVCDKYNMKMIEDSSQALGMPMAGRIGDVGVFSFSVPKIVTTGQGGVLFTDNESIFIKAKQIRDQGDEWRKDKIHRNIGVNFKFNDILASYGMAQLNRLNELLTIRKNIFDWYREDIEIVDYGYDSTWMVIYRTKNALKIIDELKKLNIQAVQYYRPINTNPPYSCFGCKFPISEILYEELLYLPSSLTLNNENIEIITSIIRKCEQ